MELKQVIILWCLTAMVIGIGSGTGMGGSKYFDGMGTPGQAEQPTIVPDWLSPGTAGRPEWDPYGPDSAYYPAADRPEWDPYGPSYSPDILRLEPADPTAAALAVEGNLQSPNQLYLQRDGLLVPEGRVILGEPYVLWARVGYWGSLVLYDNKDTILSQSYVRPGWYRITGLYPEILWSHAYRFNSAGIPSNQLNVLVDAGGYPINYGLTGRVVDASGIGIPGVRVILTGSDGGIFTTATNPGGYYGFNAPSGVYSITAEMQGYSFTPSQGRAWTGTISVARTIIGYPDAGLSPAPFLAAGALSS